MGPYCAARAFFVKQRNKRFFHAKFLARRPNDGNRSRYGSLAWCGTCDDLTLEVADAVGLPKEAFDPESDYWRIRGEVVLEIHGYLDRRPWEPPEE